MTNMNMKRNGMGCNCIYLTFSLSFYLLVSLFAAKNERFCATFEKHRSENKLSVFVTTPRKKHACFIPTRRASISATLVSGKYGHVYLQGPVVQKSVSLTLGYLEIQSKFSNSLFLNLDILLQKSCLDQKEFSFLKFWNKRTCRNTETKTAG